MSMFDSVSVDGPTAKRAHVGDMQAPPSASTIVSSGRAPAFGSSAQRTRSYQEEAAVPTEVRSRLESIGMRTRFNVNRGYGMPPASAASSSAAAQHPTHLAMRTNASVHGSGTSLLTESDVLQHVYATRSAWSRTASAPQWGNELQPFGGQGIRPTLLATAAEEGEAMQSITGDENQDPLAAHFGGDDDDIDIGGEDGTNLTGYFDASDAALAGSAANGFVDLKRSRDEAAVDGSASDALARQQQQLDAQMYDKPIRGLPSLSRRSGASPFGATRVNGGATTLPVTSGLTHYLASNAVLPTSNGNVVPDSDDAAWAQHNFSAFSRSDNF